MAFPPVNRGETPSFSIGEMHIPREPGDNNSYQGERTIRSFVRRAGRMTRAQRRALDDHWCDYGLPDDVPLRLDGIFFRQAPRVLEIGFGMGESLASLAQQHPEWDFLGVEVYPPGVGSLCARLSASGSSNVRILCADAADVLAKLLPVMSLDAVLVFFPDPWPKKRHHKRRLIQPAFADQIHTRLRPGGTLHLATDWEDYAQQMLTVIEGHGGFVNTAGAGAFAERAPERLTTRFERRGEQFGYRIRDLSFTRCPQARISHQDTKDGI